VGAVDQRHRVEEEKPVGHVREPVSRPGAGANRMVEARKLPFSADLNSQTGSIERLKLKF
jgi:hypothetical protein